MTIYISSYSTCYFLLQLIMTSYDCYVSMIMADATSNTNTNTNTNSNTNNNN